MTRLRLFVKDPALFLALILLVVITGCSRPASPEKIFFTGKAQGTYYAVTYYSTHTASYQSAVDSLLKEFDLTASLWVKNSLISRVNNREDILVNADFQELFRISQKVSEATGGYFDITVGPLVNAWGFGADSGPVIIEGMVDSLLPLVNFRKVQIRDGKVIMEDPRMRIDFNAVAQGYSVDLVSAFLESKGIDDYLVDIGGEVYAHGSKPGGEPWKVGIERPSENASAEREIFAELPVANQAVATSGNYRKYYEKNGVRYAHTIDPKTGYPVNHSLLSVTVVAGSCAVADAWATAIMAMGTEKALQMIRKKHTGVEIFGIQLIREKDPGFEIFGIYSDRDTGYKTFMTEGLKKSLSEIR